MDALDPQAPEFDPPLTLCCRNKNGCPTIERSSEGFLLRGDHGERVPLEREQAEQLLGWLQTQLARWCAVCPGHAVALRTLPTEGGTLELALCDECDRMLA